MSYIICLEGESKTATIKVTVKPAGLNCTAELWLSRYSDSPPTRGIIPPNYGNTIPPVNFISEGVEQTINLVVPIPSSGQLLYSFINIMIENKLIAGYKDNINQVAIVETYVDSVVWS